MSYRRWICAAIAAALIPLTACAPDPSSVAVPQSATQLDDQPVVVEDPTPSAPESTATPVEPPAPQPVETETPQPIEPDEPPTEEPETADTSEPTPTADPTPEAPAPDPKYSPGQSGEDIRELQHRLSQLNWFSGEITGNYGPATSAAVDGFQSKRGFPVLGYVDETTWDRLVEMSREPTDDEKHNIQPVEAAAGPALLKNGDRGEEVKDLQARLKQIGWFHEKVTGNYGPVTTESVRGFQDKRELPVTGAVDQQTLDALHNMTRKPTADELADVPREGRGDSPMVLDPRCTTGRAVCVSKSQNKLAWVVDGEIKFTADVRFGSELTPTRNGAWSVGWKSRDHVSSLYDSKMPFALFFSGGQAIHYSADFAARGYNGSSHGCVNLRDRQVAETLFDTTRVGDKVIVY